MDGIKVMRERDIGSARSHQRIVGIAAQAFCYLFLIFMALVVLFPFYWMINSSLKSLAEYKQSVPTFWPNKVLWSNYAEAFSSASLGRLFLNTAYVGIVSTLLSLVITILSAFAFARLEFRGKDLLFSALLATMMIPGELFTITNYSTVTMLGWRNTYTVLIVPLPRQRILYLSFKAELFADTQRALSCRQGGRYERLQISVQGDDTAFSAYAYIDNHIKDDGRVELLHMAEARGQR